jgi:predicted secreted acid phosphatase
MLSSGKCGSVSLIGAVLVTSVVVSALAFDPARAEVPAGCEAKSNPPVPDLSDPPNLDLFKRELLYYRCTKYEQDIAAVLKDARDWVAKRALQVSNPAIVLDIDETSLSNWKRIYVDDFAFIQNGRCDFTEPNTACGDTEWEASAQAPAIEPTLRLYKFARCIEVSVSCKPIEVFFITGRRDSKEKHRDKTPREWTMENLKNAGYGIVAADHLYMRPVDSNGMVAPFKSGVREEIEKRNFTIIANIGDQQSDLAGGHAERTFKVPNPFYFIP